MKNQSFFRRLGFACTGIINTFKNEVSFRSQTYLGLVAAAFLAVLKPPAIWVALCVLAAGCVLALELLNTALERLADRLHPERHESIRIAKDCAAAAVLVAAIVALIIGMFTIAVSIGYLQ